MEKRFKVGDWIFVDGVIEGVVEDIGFRSTVVRKFDKSLATIPNFQFAEKAVINQSETSNRRIEWVIGLEYKTTSKKLEQIRNEILEFIKKDEDFIISASTPCAVNLNQFSASSIDILIRCYTKTNSYYEWLKVKDKFVIKIKQIVESADASFAFPSQSIYLEKFEKMNSLIILIDNIIYLFSLVLIINIILSWLATFNVINTSNRFVYTVLDVTFKLTDPLLNPIRRFLPNIAGLDFSPIILFLILGFLRNLLREYGFGLL